jgi:hypothetical protein
MLGSNRCLVEGQLIVERDGDDRPHHGGDPGFFVGHADGRKVGVLRHSTRRRRGHEHAALERHVGGIRGSGESA